jgi:hypothetical protein
MGPKRAIMHRRKLHQRRDLGRVVTDERRAERAGDEQGVSADETERHVEHPQDPAEGAEETEQSPGTERAGDGG